LTIKLTQCTYPIRVGIPSEQCERGISPICSTVRGNAVRARNNRSCKPVTPVFGCEPPSPACLQAEASARCSSRQVRLSTLRYLSKYCGFAPCKPHGWQNAMPTSFGCQRSIPKATSIRDLRSRRSAALVWSRCSESNSFEQ